MYSQDDLNILSNWCMEHAIKNAYSIELPGQPRHRLCYVYRYCYIEAASTFIFDIAVYDRDTETLFINLHAIYELEPVYAECVVSYDDPVTGKYIDKRFNILSSKTIIHLIVHPFDYVKTVNSLGISNLKLIDRIRNHVIYKIKRRN